ncbi:uncharacterized protein LOC111005737 isoform X2 [Momordica charantia]|uniref:Uncharacterized protein LOC111005737 isoform X2 n=1 Tax=Momordica charantia TaxID=3673 RepID=A0A6J1BTX8_MOMCH|nr:uncharacterized protein LOC111005737 isoform X2 [Momordica charantia]
MAEIVGGAALGAVAGEMLKGAIGLVEGAIYFKRVVEDIRFRLRVLGKVMEQLDGISDFLDDPKNTKYLSKLLGQGKQLIIKCEGVKGNTILIKYFKAPFYTTKLRHLDARLKTATELLDLRLREQQAMDNTHRRHSCANHHASAPTHTKLPLVFCHDKRISGKIGPNLAETLVGKVLEYTKGDPQEESGETNPEEKSVGERIVKRMKETGERQYKKIFQRTFDMVAGEELQNWFRCDMLRETGAVMGFVYVSTAKFAFCTKRLYHPCNKNKHYIKVIISFHELKAVNVAATSECIKVISVDNQEFELINFRNYNAAKKCLQQLPVAPTCPRCNAVLLL